MIIIDENKLIAIGSSRLIYIHPDNNKKLIKVFKPSQTPEMRRKTIWYKRFQSLEKFNENKRDFIEHQKARGKCHEAALSVCNVYGIEKTNYGDGLIEERICDIDGNTSITLKDYVQNNGLKIVSSNIDDLFDIFSNNHILFRDAYEMNILVQELDVEFRLVVIDGLGESNLIPYASFSKTLNARKLRHKKERMIRRLSVTNVI
jgi:hypothetical protein